MGGGAFLLTMTVTDKTMPCALLLAAAAAGKRHTDTGAGHPRRPLHALEKSSQPFLSPVMLRLGAVMQYMKSSLSLGVTVAFG